MNHTRFASGQYVYRNEAKRAGPDTASDQTVQAVRSCNSSFHVIFTFFNPFPSMPVIDANNSQPQQLL